MKYCTLKLQSSLQPVWSCQLYIVSFELMIHSVTCGRTIVAICHSHHVAVAELADSVRKWIGPLCLPMAGNLQCSAKWIRLQVTKWIQVHPITDWGVGVVDTTSHPGLCMAWKLVTEGSGCSWPDLWSKQLRKLELRFKVWLEETALQCSRTNYLMYLLEFWVKMIICRKFLKLLKAIIFSKLR